MPAPKHKFAKHKTTNHESHSYILPANSSRQLSCNLFDDYTSLATTSCWRSLSDSPFFGIAKSKRPFKDSASEFTVRIIQT